MQRERVVYAYLVFLIIWFAFVFACVKFIGISAMEGLGLGAATGIFLTGFTLMWQFIWRKAAPSAPTANPPTATPAPPEKTDGKTV